MNEDRATRYHRLARRAELLSLIWSGALLIALLASGASIRLRDLAAAAVTGVRTPQWLALQATVAAYVVLLAALHECGALPLGFYRGYLLERRYGLSTETVRQWLYDRGKAGVIGLTFAVAGSSVLYAAIRRWPEDWWWVVALVFTLFLVLLTNLAPVVLLPLFYRFKPLERTALRDRLIALAGRAGAPVVGVYEWRLSDRTRKANAALAGLGRTRRILLSDTLLEENSDEEIEVILAHELAHHVHRDIWKGIALQTALTFAGFYVAGRVLENAAPRLGLTGAADVAGLPLLLLSGGVLSLMLLPLANAISRAHERRADRYALELTRNPAAFVSAMRRLASQNLAEEDPSAIVRWLFHTHPPIRERIADAQRWMGGGGRFFSGIPASPR